MMRSKGVFSVIALCSVLVADCQSLPRVVSCCDNQRVDFLGETELPAEVVL